VRQRGGGQTGYRAKEILDPKSEELSPRNSQGKTRRGSKTIGLEAPSRGTGSYVHKEGGDGQDNLKKKKKKENPSKDGELERISGYWCPVSERKTDSPYSRNLMPGIYPSKGRGSTPTKAPGKVGLNKRARVVGEDRIRETQLGPTAGSRRRATQARALRKTRFVGSTMPREQLGGRETVRKERFG